MKKHRYLPDALALGAITLIIVLFFFRLFFPTPQLIVTPDFGQSDAVTHFATKYLLNNQLAHYRIPLWTSLLGGGYPIFAHGSTGAFYIPDLLLFSIFPPIYAYIFTLLLSVCFLGWGMYSWLRLMDYKRISSVFGAMTLALSGYVISQCTHITIIQSLSLFPAIASGTYILAKNRSWYAVVWLIFLFSQQILVGFPQSVFITMLFMTAYFVYLVRSNKRWLHDIGRFIVSFIGGCALSAVQLLPSLEYSSNLVTSKGFSPQEATYFSYPFKHLLTLLYPFILGNPSLGTYENFITLGGSIFWENTAYIGIVPLVCIILYIFISRRLKCTQKTPVFFIIVLVGSFLLMTGKYSPLYFIFSLWPFNIFRVPSRFTWLFEVALVIISVHAFNALYLSLKNKLLASIIILIQVSMIYFIWSSYHLFVPANSWLQTPPLAQYIDKSGYTITVGGELLYNEIYEHGWSKNPSYFLRNTLTPDKSMLWSIPQIRDYAGRYLKRSKILDDLLDQAITTDVTYATISAFGGKLLNILAIKNVISTLPLTQDGLSPIKEITEGSRSITLYNNPDALPKAYIASSTIPVSTVEQAVKVMESDAFNPGKTVLVEADDARTNSHNSTVVVNSQEDGPYTFQIIDAQKGDILVITETYYPGWHLLVDGVETPNFPVNIKHIGTELSAGDHRVSAYYLPDSFMRGAWISIVSLIVIVSLTAFAWLRGI